MHNLDPLVERVASARRVAANADKTAIAAKKASEEAWSNARVLERELQEALEENITEAERDKD